MVNISQRPEAFFQSDAEIAKQLEKEAKYNYTEGSAINVKTKVLDIILSQDGKHLYTAQAGNIAKKISLENSKVITLFKGHDGPVTSLALNHLHLYTGSWDKSVKQWDLETGECTATLTGHTDFVKSLVLIGNYLFSGSADGYLFKWNLDTLKNESYRPHQRSIESLTVSEDWKFIYSASSDGTVIKSDVETMRLVKTFEGHDTSIYCVRVVGEEDMWTASADKTVRRWNIDTGVVNTVLPHPDRVKSLVVAGSYVITGSSDDEIRVWDIGSATEVCTIEGHFDEVGALCTYGATLYSGSLDCSVRQWPLTLSAFTEYNQKVKQKKLETEKKSSGMTEEEERELNELMDSEEEL